MIETSSLEDRQTMPPAFGALAWRFAMQVARADGSNVASSALAQAAGLLMRATLSGHTCLTLDQIADGAEDAGIDRLDPDRLRTLLPQHPWVGNGNGSTPLVFEGDRLYLRRFRDAEQRLAAAIRARTALPADAESLRGLAPRFQEILSQGDEPDWQDVAVSAALRSRFALITGGPGTGKTTTVAHLLALLIEQNPEVKVALAAPTGKAAARLGEAIRGRWAAIGMDPVLQERLPSAGQTLHRLLGYLPQRDTFRHKSTDPLQYDVVVVDEASMVPLLLMDILFAALRRDARVILLGDHDQLASVEAGSVLTDLVNASGALRDSHGVAFGHAYSALSGKSIPTAPEVAPLRDVVVRLTRSHRFDDSTGIGALARAIRDGDADAAIGVLRGSDPSVIRGPVSSRDEGWVDEVAAQAESVTLASSAQQALQAFTSSRVLCATNVGRAGTEAIVVRVEQALRRRGVHIGSGAYRGMPFLLNRNDYSLGLFNGDTGVVWEADGALCAFVTGLDSTDPLRSFPLPQLPDAVTAWAMTVHKSQGSEFDSVTVVLPDEDMPVLTRELLYTAVSRAKKRVVIVGPEQALRAAIGRTARRGSGLASRLA